MDDKLLIFIQKINRETQDYLDAKGSLQRIKIAIELYEAAQEALKFNKWSDYVSLRTIALYEF